MAHRTKTFNFIRTDDLVYSKSTLRNLVRKIWLKCSLNRSKSDVERGISIRVENSAAFDTSKDEIIPVFSVNNMADWTFLGSASCLDFDYLYGFSDADIIQSREELAIWNSTNESVELPSFVMTPQISYVLDSNHSIKFFSNSNNLPSNLFTSCLDEIALPVFQSPKIFFIVYALQFYSSRNIFSLPDSNLPSEIELPQNFLSNRIVESYGRKVHRTNVDTYYNILINQFWKVFLEDNFNLIFGNYNSFEIPTVFKKTIKSLISPIPFNGNNNLFIFKKSKPDAESSSFCKKCFESSVFKFRREFGKIIFEIPPSHPYFQSASLDELREELGFISQFVISQLMQLFLRKGVVCFEN